MKLSKITAKCMATLMTTAALGTFPVCAHSVTPADEIKLKDIETSIWATNQVGDIDQAVENTSPSFTVNGTKNSYTINIAEDSSVNDYPVVYTVTTDTTVSDDLTGTIKNENSQSADIFNYRISFDKQSSKLLISKNGGETWNELPITFSFKPAK